ncbi:MAG: RNA 2',3'-cyclic phosphodiesterase [Candidatus Nanoarchaeia archaeon]|nr:RNA 2',3'-cyclic phosphodiesterase [Candidatus Nanoarchaeia archaeon]MDD5358519.1 RNA 2',3'-cyclic phosphodiesterase [Candidatus Nanoarchaeia archaeon]MDD5589033.1 RNA 2',3'-cyclic phosphodiesterase [Candidatus Nanoarchaeia archaeon]
MRTFIAIDIPEKIKKEVLKIQEQLPPFEGKKTEFENLHLTLKFLGEVSDDKIEKVKEKLREIQFNPFETEIDSLGFFDNRKSNKYEQSLIVWLHMKNCDELQKQVDSKLERLFEKEKRFMSHLTIARVKSVENKKKFTEKLYKINIPKMNFYVNNFILKESVLTSPGSIYKNIEIYRGKI